MTAVTDAPDFWLGSSWKMTKTLAEARTFVDELIRAELPASPRLFLLPAHTALAAVRDRLGGDSQVLLGAQNAHAGPEGAVTGEVSMRMARDAGAELVELGHAERRMAFCETDDLVAAKVVAAVDAGLTPLVCVGETLEQRCRGVAVDVVVAQVRAALGGLGRVRANVWVAYEPHWAIGSSGQAAFPDEVAEVIDAIRVELPVLLPEARCRVFYGGSVGADNVRAFVSGLSIDGLFVGRAAWTASGFLDLAHRCSAALEERIGSAPTHSTRREET